MKNIQNEVITYDNVQELGEMIAIKALMTTASHSGGKLDYLYKGLLYDVYKRNTVTNHVFSDGYDYAQIAMCFLLENIGKRLSDYYGISNRGKKCNVLYACYHYIDKHLTNFKKDLKFTTDIDNKMADKTVFNKKEDDYTTSKNVCLQGHFYDLVQAHSHDGGREKCGSILFSEENDCVNYTEYDTIISNMKLKKGELDTLNCYMAGMTYCEIARFLNVNFSTICRRRQSLQRKYLQAIKI